MASDLSPQMVEYAERTVDDILEVSHPTSLTCSTIGYENLDQVSPLAALCCNSAITDSTTYLHKVNCYTLNTLGSCSQVQV